MAEDRRVAILQQRLDAAEAQLAEQAQLHALLRESETRHRLLIESWAQAVWETDPDGVVVADSPSWRAYTGQSLDEWLGYGWLDAVHPDDRAYAERQWREAIAARALVDAEFRLCAPHGGWRWTNVRAAPVTDAAGRIVKWAGINIDVDARKSAEAALRQSEERYHALFESMDEACAVVEVLKDERGAWADFRFVDANPAFVAHTSMPWPVGKTATELLGRPNPRWTQLYGQALETGEPIRLEEDEPTLERIFDLNIFALEREHNRVAVLFTNITERKRAEAALRQREADLARVQRIGAVGGLDIDVAGGLTSRRSPEYMRLHGLAPDAAEATHAEWRSRVHPADVVQAENTLFAALDGDASTYESEYRIVRPSDGEVRWIAARADIERDADGKALRLVGAHIDVTEQKLVQEALRDSEERLRSAAEVAKFGLWDWNVETGAVTWSDEHFRLQGYAVAEVAPSYEAWVARVHPDDRADTEAAIVSARDSHGEYVHEFRVLHPDGTVRWVSARARFFYDPDGRPVRMIGAMLDTTERRVWEDRQKVLLAELQHRVRNILAVIRSIVSRSDDGERSTMDYVQHLQGRLSALARTQGLLTRSAGAGVDLRNMMLDELVAQATRAEQFALDGPDIELSPKAAEVLSLAIHELATNATKYGAFARPGGSLRVEWHSETRGADEWLVLRWTERGVAIVDAVPRREGFGTELISRRIPYELQGHGSFTLRPGGLSSVIEFPLRRGDSILQTSRSAR